MKTSLKKYVIAGFAVVGILAGAGTTWAQAVGGGVKVGVNFASVSGDVGAEKSIRTGFIGGGFLTVPRDGMLAFQPEVLFSQQGVKLSEDGEDFTAKIDEVQVPLLLRVGRSSGAGGYFLVGPSIGMITSAKFTDGSEEEDFKDDLKSTDIGVVVGAGMMVNRFLIEGRYTAGLTNLNEDEDEGDNKSRVFAVLVGVGF